MSCAALCGTLTLPPGGFPTSYDDTYYPGIDGFPFYTAPFSWHSPSSYNTGYLYTYVYPFCIS